LKTPYLPGDIIDQIRNARGFGVSWEIISNKLGFPVDQCREAIGLPALRPIPDEASEPDLFAGVGFLGDEQNGSAA
jgi:hypothetical protein